MVVLVVVVFPQTHTRRSKYFSNSSLYYQTR